MNVYVINSYLHRVSRIMEITSTEKRAKIRQKALQKQYPHLYITVVEYPVDEVIEDIELLRIVVR